MTGLPTCKEYATSVASGELENAGLLRRFAGFLHWLMCKYCRAYVRQLRSVNEAARRRLRREPPDPESIERLEASLAEACRQKTQKRPAD